MERLHVDPDESMTRVRSGRAMRSVRRGMTLIEVILAIVIMSGAMLGLANFSRIFQHNTSTNIVTTLASDLATQKIEEIKGYRVYATLVSTYHATSTTYATDPTYKGFTVTVAAVRCSGCPTATNDYVTVTVSVTGNGMASTVKKTTIIAAF